MPQPSFSIAIIHRKGDLLSLVDHVEPLHCPDCKGLQFHTPDHTKELNIVKCLSCFNLFTVCELFINAISPF